MNVRPHVLRAAAAAALLAPFGLSVAAHVVPDPMSSPAASERPSLVFGEYLVNLGRLPEGRAATGLFRFRNAGETPLKVLGVSPSCGCLKPRLEKLDYRPGEPGAFFVQADTANETPGSEDHVKQHYVDVSYDAGHGAETARVHLKFVLPARHVSVEPRALLVYQFDSQPTTREITISDTRTPPATITAVNCLSPLVSVESQLAEDASDPRRATLVVTVPGTIEKDVRTVIRLQTDEPGSLPINIPVSVFVKPNDRTAAAPPDAPR